MAESRHDEVYQRCLLTDVPIFFFLGYFRMAFCLIFHLVESLILQFVDVSQAVVEPFRNGLDSVVILGLPFGELVHVYEDLDFIVQLVELEASF